MNYLRSAIALLLIASCGGGGGGGPSVPFTLNLAPNNISTDEDTIYSGSLAADANEVVTLTYALTTQASNGQVSLSANGGAVTYTPNENFKIVK